jgi:hypothetical protein
MKKRKQIKYNCTVHLTSGVEQYPMGAIVKKTPICLELYQDDCVMIYPWGKIDWCQIKPINDTKMKKELISLLKRNL